MTHKEQLKPKKEELQYPEVKINPTKPSHPCHHGEKCYCGRNKENKMTDQLGKEIVNIIRSVYINELCDEDTLLTDGNIKLLATAIIQAGFVKLEDKERE